MKFIGYMLAAAASMVLARNGFGLDTWQWWVISTGFIIGQTLVCNGGK